MPPVKTQPAPQGEKHDIAYWMGTVDTRLLTMLELLQTNQVNWKEFDQWQRITNDRLAEGAQKFVDLERRMQALENIEICPAGQKCAQLVAQKKSDEATKDRFVTWKDILVDWVKPVAIGFTLYFLFTLLPQIVKLLP